MILKPLLDSVDPDQTSVHTVSLYIYNSVECNGSVER